MNAGLTPQLSAWLAATDIDGLELRGPGVQLRLRREGLRVVALRPSEPLAPAPAAAARTLVAPTVGIFLHRHPLHEAPLAAPGSAVQAGQVLGLLRIGALLLPVPAPEDGTLLAHACADGALAGYGTPLLHWIPAAAD
jgi:acetyl-CoA carboxylase biotin carboxyl carrier protein